MTPFEQADQNLRARGALTLDEFISVSAHWSIKEDPDEQYSPTGLSPEAPEYSPTHVKATSPVNFGNSSEAETTPPDRAGREALSILCSSTVKAEEGLEEGSLKLLYPDHEPIPQAAPSETDVTKESLRDHELDSSSQTIMNTCSSGANGVKILPKWQLYPSHRREKEEPIKYGSALEMWRVDCGEPLQTFSTDATYPTPGEAQVACSQLAINAGVLLKIKHELNSRAPSSSTMSRGRLPSLPDEPISVQAFNDELPRPDLGLKDGLFGNTPPSSYMHTLVMNARGAGIQVKDYYWTREVNGIVLYGCVLRLERAQEVLTYLAEARFVAPNQAKSAAALVALSRGLKAHLEKVHAESLSKVDNEHKVFCTQRLYPMLTSLCSKHGARIEYSYKFEKNAWGATLDVYFKPSAPPASPDHRWTVEPEHINKANAKTAVAYLAGKEGLVERIQFRKKSPPPGHVMWWDAEHKQNWKPNVQAGKKRTILEANAGESAANTHTRAAKRRSTGSRDSGSTSTAQQESNSYYPPQGPPPLSAPPALTDSSKLRRR